MTIDKYIANFVIRIQCYRLWHMRYPTFKKTVKNINATILLYGLAEAMVEGLY